ncbi:phospholipase D family protein [Alcanivorax sp. DP30]|nr:phospholipase D family protein [Alcanivorax sp. DP30]
MKTLALSLALLCTACHGLGHYDPQARPLSEALPPPNSGPLYQTRQTLMSEHEGETGLLLLRDGLSAFVARVAMIEAAQSSLDIQYYIFSPDVSGSLIISKLLEAADRGVRIRLLVDDIGTPISDPHVSTLAQHPNIAIRIFNPVAGRAGLSRSLQLAFGFSRTNHRMHNKLMLADHTLLLTGGRNVADEYFSNNEVDFQDIDVVAVGEVVTQGAQSFDEYWNSPVAVPTSALLDADDADMTLDELRSALKDFLHEQRHSEFARALAESSMGQALLTGEIELTWGQATLHADPPSKAYARDDTPQDAYLGTLLRREMDNTRSRAWLTSAYFIPGDKGVELLSTMERKGVDIRVLTNSLSTTDVAIVHSGYSRYREPLLESGVALWELRSQAGQQQRMHWFHGSSRASLHAKTFVFDEDRTFIGSVNLDGRSLLQNTEVGLLIHSNAINQQLSQIFEEWVHGDSAWKLSLTGDGDLRWQASNDGEPLELDHDPETSGWQRFKVWWLSLLPIESQI